MFCCSMNKKKDLCFVILHGDKKDLCDCTHPIFPQLKLINDVKKGSVVLYRRVGVACMVSHCAM